MRSDGDAFVLTPGGVLVPRRTVFNTTFASPWNAIVTGPGVLKMLNIARTGTALNGVVSIFDALNTLGTSLVKINPGNFNTSNQVAATKLLNLPFSTGLSISYTSTVTQLIVSTVTADDQPRLVVQSVAAPPWNALITGAAVLKGIGIENNVVVDEAELFDNTVIGGGNPIANVALAASENQWEDLDIPIVKGLSVGLLGGAVPTRITITYTLK